MNNRPFKFRNFLWPKDSSVQLLKKIEDDADVVLIEEEIVYKEENQPVQDNIIEIKVENNAEEANENEIISIEESQAKCNDNEIDIMRELTMSEIKKARKKVADWMELNILKTSECINDDISSSKTLIQKDLDSEEEDVENFFMRSASQIEEPINRGNFGFKDYNIKEESNELEMNRVIDLTSTVNCVAKNTAALPAVPWVQLAEQQTYNVNITEFNGSEFFVELADETVRTPLKRRLKKLKLTKFIEHFEPGDHCLVEAYGEIHRAMIQFYNDESACCFSVDTGEIFYFKDSLNEPPFYKMPSKIRKIVPFQAIRCKLHGLYIRNNVQWINYIRTTVIQKMLNPSIYVVHCNETSDDNHDPLKAMDEYTVILRDTVGEDTININSLLIQYQLAEENMSNIVIS